MSQALGMGMGQAVAEESIEEARSVLGSLITQIIATIRTILRYVMHLSNRIIEYASQHPLALILLTANVCIWIS